ncbi:MAG TPA: hypothetical protein VGC56_13875 [Allosphingosinicella sp.]|jgi:hypothetical protein
MKITVNLALACLFLCTGTASFSKDPPVPRKVVSGEAFRAGISKLNGKQIGAPITADGVVCHKLGRVNYFIVTGVDSKTGGMFCHMH